MAKLTRTKDLLPEHLKGKKTHNSYQQIKGWEESIANGTMNDYFFIYSRYGNAAQMMPLSDRARLKWVELRRDSYFSFFKLEDAIEAILTFIGDWNNVTIGHWDDLDRVRSDFLSKRVRTVGQIRRSQLMESKKNGSI